MAFRQEATLLLPALTLSWQEPTSCRSFWSRLAPPETCRSPRRRPGSTAPHARRSAMPEPAPKLAIRSREMTGLPSAPFATTEPRARKPVRHAICPESHVRRVDRRICRYATSGGIPEPVPYGELADS